MDEYPANTASHLINHHLSVAIALFKQQVLTYIRTKGNDSNFKDYLDAEAALLLSRINFAFEDIMKIFSHSHDNSTVALQKANYIIKLQNLSLMITSHLEALNG